MVANIESLRQSKELQVRKKKKKKKKADKVIQKLIKDSPSDDPFHGKPIC